MHPVSTVIWGALMHVHVHVSLKLADYTGWLSEVYIPGSGIKVPGSIQAPGVYTLLAASLDLNLSLVYSYIRVYLHLKEVNSMQPTLA